MTSVICDLDGVVYRGDREVPGSADALGRLRQAGRRLVFVTNNSTRTPEATAAKIESITGIGVSPDDICTSAVAAASSLGPDDSPALIVGEDGIRQAIAGVGITETDDPARASSVLVGLYRDVGYGDIAAAAEAVRRGARYVATNTDPTYPTADGMLPGSGAIVAAISAVAGRQPEVSGKPHPPMRALIRALGVGPAWVVGDRVDTDMALADDEEDWASILVLSGVTSEGDPVGSADHVVSDLAAAADLVLSSDERR